MVLWIDFDRAHKMLAGLFETCGLVQQVAVIHQGRNVIWCDLQKRTKGIAGPGQHPKVFERQRQIVLDARNIGVLEAALMGLCLNFEETAAMTDALPVLFRNALFQAQNADTASPDGRRGGRWRRQRWRGTHAAPAAVSSCP